MALLFVGWLLLRMCIIYMLSFILARRLPARPGDSRRLGWDGYWYSRNPAYALSLLLLLLCIRRRSTAAGVACFSLTHHSPVGFLPSKLHFDSLPQTHATDAKSDFPSQRYHTLLWRLFLCLMPHLHFGQNAMHIALRITIFMIHVVELFQR